MANLRNKKEEKNVFQSSYMPMDIVSMTNEWNDGAISGEKSYVAELDQIFAWMRGHVNGWYGWANDGKGTFFDFMAVMKSKYDGWKWGMMKQEDMSVYRYKDDDDKWRTRVTPNNIFNNLIWTYTGKTPIAAFAKRKYTEKIQLEEYHEAAEWVRKHFFVIHPRDRRYPNIMDEFRFLYEKFGIDGFLVDPFKSIKLDSDKRGDWLLDDLFIETKTFAQDTNTVFNFIAHPKSMVDTRIDRKPDSAYKVVNQFMVSGGAAWDNNMDAQYSIYRPERHLNPSHPGVHFHNLKQRQAELVGVLRGSYEQIKFDNNTKRYFFNGTCPLDNSHPADRRKVKDFTESSAGQLEIRPGATDDLPF